MNKYELVKEDYITLNNGKILYRIKSLKDFNDVNKGDLGGYIESESNLSHEGNCWAYNEAKVMDNAVVKDNVNVSDVIVYDNIVLGGYANIKGNDYDQVPIGRATDFLYLENVGEKHDCLTFYVSRTIIDSEYRIYVHSKYFDDFNIAKRFNDYIIPEFLNIVLDKMPSSTDDYLKAVSRAQSHIKHSGLKHGPDINKANFKIRVVKNIGEHSKKWFGEIGTILEVKDSVLKCLNGKVLYCECVDDLDRYLKFEKKELRTDFEYIESESERRIRKFFEIILR